MEIWKDIKNYKGLYQVSNLGRVKNVKRIVKISKNKEKYKEVPEHILKPYINKSGYAYVTLANNGNSKNVRVHRLVAETFIPNTYDKSQVNHINGIKTDNRVENLEWVTCQENIKKAWDTGLRDNNREIIKKCLIERNKKRDYSKNKYKTIIIQYDLNGNIIEKYKTMLEAGIKYNVHNSTISRWIKNKTTKNGLWKKEMVN